MRRICLLILMAVMTVTAFAQYTKVSCARFPQAMDIVQIDYRESSTIVFLKYICQEGITWLSRKIVGIDIELNCFTTYTLLS